MTVDECRTAARQLEAEHPHWLVWYDLEHGRFKAIRLDVPAFPENITSVPTIEELREALTNSHQA